MKPFTIGEVRDVFAADLAGFQSDIASLLVDALAHPDRPLDLTVGRRHAHTMKGMASLVRADALTRWAVGLESLLIRAESVAPGSPEQMEDILHWIVSQLPLWSELCDATLREDFSAADAHYASIRASMDELIARWPNDVAPPLPVKPPNREPEAPAEVVPEDLAEASRSETTSKLTLPGIKPPPALTPPTLNKAAKSSAPTFKPAETADLKPAVPPSVITPAFKQRKVATPAVSHAKSKSDSKQLNSVCPSLLPPKLKTAASRPAVPEAPSSAAPVDSTEQQIPVTSESPTIEFSPTEINELDASPTESAPGPIFVNETPVVPLTSPRELAPQPASARPVQQGHQSEMLAAFAQDAQDQLEVLEQAILRLEKGEDIEEQLAVARRCFHTLKGAANSVELPALGQSFHEVEDFVETTANKKENQLPAGFCPFLLSCVDDLRRYVDAAESGTTENWNCSWLSRIQAILAGNPLPLTGTPAKSEATAAFSSAPSHAPAASKEASSPQPQLEESQTIRVDANRLRTMMNLMGALVIDRNRLERQLAQLDEQHDQLAESRSRVMQLVASFQKEFEFNLIRNRETRPPKQLRAPALPAEDEEVGESVLWDESGGDSGTDFSELEFDRYDQFGIMARQMTEVANDLEEVIREMRQTHQALLINHQQFARTSKQMQDEATGLSLLPLSSLFKRLVRVFRDATQVEEKSAELQFDGENTLLDKTIMDAMYAPMLHLLRNAVAHGLESAEGRAQAGKPAKGLVQVRAHASGSQVRIEVHDDGRGIDPAKVRARAIQRGLLPPDAPESLSLPEAVAMLFTPGFSTAEKITSLSGRGVGLDVVRSEVEALGGVIQVVSHPGKGSVWIVLLPLTLTVAEALVGTLDGRPFALPVNFLERGVVADPQRITTRASGKDYYRTENEDLPVLYLADLFGVPVRPANPHGLVLRVGEQKALLLLEPGFVQQDIVVKPLDSLITRHPFLSGATVDGEGNVFFILNIPGILQHGLLGGFKGLGRAQRAPGSVRTVGSRPRVLVVDDSLSVRKVQERILSDLGCDVTTSNDGLQALEKLRENEFQLILTDLEMPGMDGYQLISEVRNLPQFTSIPIVVVSSRSTARYTDKAITLGANACLTKPFTPEDIDAMLDRYVRLNPSEVIAA